MRADVAPLLANALMIVPGAALLVALRVPLRTPLAWLGALGLAYIAGTAVTLIALEILLVIGVPFGLVTFVAVCVLITAAGFGAALLRRRRAPDADRFEWRWRPALDWRRPGLDNVVVAVFVVVLGVVGWYLLDVFRNQPLDQWDAWSIWTRKALMLVHADSLGDAFWTGDAYSFMHQDYPILLPLLEAIWFRAGAEIDTQAVHAQLLLLLFGFIWAAAWVASRVARPLVWAPVLLLVPLASGVYNELLRAYADVPMALFFGLGVVLLGIWIDQREGWQLWLGAIMLAAAAGVKNEGLLAAGAALVCLTAVLAVLRERPALVRIAGAWTVFLAGVLPWRIWIAMNDIKGDLPISKGLNPGYLADRTNRVRPSFERLQGHLADQGTWLYLVPLGVAIAIAALIVRTRSGAAAFYLATGVTTLLGLTWAYWISPNDLDWHLETSANRVIASVVFVALAAVLHLTGALVRGSPDDRTTVARS